MGPVLMDDAKGSIAISYRASYDSNGHEVVNLVEIDVLAFDFIVDTVEPFCPVEDFALPIITVPKRIIIEEEVEKKPIRIFLVGDIMLDRGVRYSVKNNAGGNYEFLFSELDWLKEADIVFGNLEGPASDKGRDLGNLYSFRMEPKVLDVLVDYGFNVLSVANNHAGDWGREAFIDTLERLDDKGIIYPGGGKNYDLARQVQIIEIEDIKFGWLGFSDVGPNWLRATENSSGILLASDPNFTNIIEQASKESDFLFVSFHFGDEYQTSANQRQRFLVEQAFSAGAQVVVGHHPHVVQEIIWQDNQLIAYSLGNFIFDQYFSKETMSSIVLELLILDGEIIEITEHYLKQNKEYRAEKIGQERIFSLSNRDISDSITNKWPRNILSLQSFSSLLSLWPFLAFIIVQ